MRLVLIALGNRLYCKFLSVIAKDCKHVAALPLSFNQKNIRELWDAESRAAAHPEMNTHGSFDRTRDYGSDLDVMSVACGVGTG